MTAEFLANANTKTIPIVVVEAVTKNSFPVNGDTFTRDKKLHWVLPITVGTLESISNGCQQSMKEIVNEAHCDIIRKYQFANEEATSGSKKPVMSH